MTPPVFAHGNLRLYLLALLEERPRHGYELIQALSDRFGGTYSPSAGTIYPRLSKLEEEGLVTKSTDGRKTVYEITDAGSAELDSRRHELDAIEDDLTDSVRRLADGVRAEVNDAMRSLRAELASAAREAKRAATSTSASGGATSAGGTTSPHVESNRAVHEADIVLNEFRQQLRTDLRTHAHRGLVNSESVSVLKARLAQVRADVLAHRSPRASSPRRSGPPSAPTRPATIGHRRPAGVGGRWFDGTHDRRRTPPVVGRRPRPAAARQHARAHGPARRRRDRRAGDRPTRALPAPAARGHRRTSSASRSRGTPRASASSATGSASTTASRALEAGWSVEAEYRGQRHRTRRRDRDARPGAGGRRDAARARVPAGRQPRLERRLPQGGLHAAAARRTSRSRPATCCTRTTGSSSSRRATA